MAFCYWIMIFSVHGCLWICLIWGLLNFLNLYVFDQIWEASSSNLFSIAIFFSFPSRTIVAQMLHFLIMLPQVPESFPFFSPDLFTLCSICKVFSPSQIVLFISKTFFWFFFIFSVSLLKTSVSSHFKNVHIYLVECSYKSWFIILFGNFNIQIDSGLHLLAVFFLSWIDQIVLIVFQVILDFILDISDTILWDSGFYKNPLEIMLILLFYIGM